MRSLHHSGMKHTFDGSLLDSEPGDRMRAELVDLQKRFILLFKASGQSLEQIRSIVESSLRGRSTEPPQTGRVSERDAMLYDLIKIVERTQRYVQLASKPPTNCFHPDALRTDYQLVSSFPVATSSSSNNEASCGFERRLERLVNERECMKTKLQESEEYNSKLQRKLKSMTHKYEELLKVLSGVREYNGGVRARTMSPGVRGGVIPKTLAAVPKQSSRRGVKEQSREQLCSENSCNNAYDEVALDRHQSSSARNQSAEVAGPLRQGNVSPRGREAGGKGEVMRNQHETSAKPKKTGEDVGSLLMKITGLKQELLVEEQHRAEALIMLVEVKRDNHRLAAQVEELKQQLSQRRASGECVPNEASLESKVKSSMTDVNKELGHTQKVAMLQELQARELTRALGKMQDFLLSSFSKQKRLIAELEKAGRGWTSTQSHDDSALQQKSRIVEVPAEVVPRSEVVSEGKDRKLCSGSHDSDDNDLNMFCERALAVDDAESPQLHKAAGATPGSQNVEMAKEDEAPHKVISKLSAMYRSGQRNPKNDTRDFAPAEEKRGGPVADVVSQPKNSMNESQIRKDNVKARSGGKDKRQVSPHSRAHQKRSHSQNQSHSQPRQALLKKQESRPQACQPTLQREEAHLHPNPLPLARQETLPQPHQSQEQREEVPPVSHPPPLTRLETLPERRRSSMTGQEAQAHAEQKQQSTATISWKTLNETDHPLHTARSRVHSLSSSSSTSTAQFLRRLEEFRFPKEESSVNVMDTEPNHTGSGREVPRGFSPPRLNYIKPAGATNNPSPRALQYRTK
uniref:Uncharacterized protein n=1 Tax=Trypanosoma congolense (strain IL3000) TaxID=1068625 RepID=G0URR3_TRYCI|nr:conserved hypothetical protein [Trypanosoma congolense IL3000]